MSTNGTAKMCLIMDEILRKDFDRHNFIRWNELKNTVMFTSLEPFIFHEKAFFFRMIKMTVNRLIDTGIMRYLLNIHLNERKPSKIKDEPKVLNLNDLDFGFALYSAFCGLSIFLFLFEIVSCNMKSK